MNDSKHWVGYCFQDDIEKSFATQQNPSSQIIISKVRGRESNYKVGSVTVFY